MGMAATTAVAFPKRYLCYWTDTGLLGMMWLRRIIL